MTAPNSRITALLEQPPLDSLLAAGQALLVLEPPAGRLVWANAAAASLFGFPCPDDPSSVPAAPANSVLRQFVRLAAGSRPGAPARLLKQRFARAGIAGAIVTMRCWRDEGSPPLFVVASLDAPQAVHEAAVEEDRAPEAVSHDVAQSPSPLERPFEQRRGNVRFLWRSDADNRLASFDDVLCEVLGCDRAALAGKSFDELIEVLPLSPAAPLRAALSRRDTWSRIEVLWPLSDGGKLAPVTLGGLPSFDRSGVFDGYSGFGVIHLDDLADNPAAKAKPASAGISTPVLHPSSPSGDEGSEAPGALVAGGTPARSDDATPARPPEPAPSNVVSLHAWQKPAPVVRSSVVSRISGPVRDEQTPAEETKTKTEAARSVEGGESSTTEEAQKEQAIAPAADSKSGPAAEDRASGGESVATALEPLPDAGSVGDPQADSQTSSAAEKLEAPRQEADLSGPQDGPQKGPKDELQDELQDGLQDGLQDDDLGGQDDKIAAGPDAASVLTGQENIGQENIGQEGIGQEDIVQENIGQEAPVRFKAPKADPDGSIELTPHERNAFREIARALGARTRKADDRGDADAPPRPLSPAAIAIALAADAREGAAAQPSGSASRETPSGATRETAPSPARLEPSRADSLLAAKAELIDTIGPGVLVLQDGKAVFANGQLLEMLGYGDFAAFEAAGGVGRMFKGRDPTALARDAAGGALPVIARNGDVLALTGTLQTARWNNRPASLLTLAEDSNREMEAKLRAQELDLRRREAEVRELHAILDTATDGVVLLNEEGRILSLNGSGQALFGYEQNEVAGESFTILLSRESHRAAMDYFNGIKSDSVRSVLNDGREVTGRAHKGGAIPMYMTLGRIAATPEQRFCVVLRDLTTWKKAERELSEARREAERTSSLKSDFLAKISHEVRTPLNAILGFAEVIIDERFGPVGNERYKDYLKDIHASGAHVLSLINDLLDLSKIEAGKMELDFGSVDVGKVVNECVSIMQSQAIRERVVIRLSLAPRLPNVVADERSLRQIVLNLLSNAVKFNEPGGQVIVSTALTDSGSAVIRIRDTGIGMEDKDVEMALEPFRQIATARRAGGTGLGLPLTKALVEANRASFTIKSKIDEGTLVEVSFPPTRVLAE